MTMVDDILTEILRATKPDGDAMKEARARRDVVFDAAMLYEGTLRTIKSGSIAHNTVSDVNCQVSDADGSLVLNRQVYPAYGPDGDGLGPRDLVESIADDLRNLVSQIYPEVYVSTDHRHAIYFRFREPLADGSNPTVDLVISLNRKDAIGLWIPNLPKDSWDAADPAQHTQLVIAKRKATKRVSTKVVRVAKLYAKQWDTPLLSSFHLTALMLSSLEKGVGLSQGLLDLFEYGAKTLKHGNTPDPAGVSGPLKIPAVHGRDKVVEKFDKAAQRLADAIALEEANDVNYDKILEKLQKIFWQPKIRDVLDLAADKVKVERAITRATTNGRSVSIAVGAVSSVRPVVSARAFGVLHLDVLAGVALVPWAFDSDKRKQFEAGLLDSGYIPIWAGYINNKFTYKIAVPVPGYGIAIIVHVELSRNGMQVFAPGLAELRHVYGDGSLCMWYPKDKRNRVWRASDGLRALLDITALHLYKELRFKETGLWPGEEVHQNA